MTESTYRPVGKLMPDWMINCTERIMQYYIDRYLNCDPVILDRPPAPQEGHQYLLYAHIPFCKTLLYKALNRMQRTPLYLYGTAAFIY